MPGAGVDPARPGPVGEDGLKTSDQTPPRYTDAMTNGVDIAVIVTCHEPYFAWLSDALESVDRQLPGPAERVVVFDGCAPPGFVPSAWQRLTGRWSDPAGARDAGLRATTAPWLVFLDADNALPHGYLSAAQRAIERAGRQVAIVYPDIQYTDYALTPRSVWSMPACDYWSLRQQNCVDTSSVWRREAIEIVGGWPHGEFLEDYILALLVTAGGWKAVPLEGPPVLMREHDNGRRSAARRRTGPLLTHLWRARSLGIVSLLAGRTSTFDRWRRFILTAELPPRTSLYVVDNSGDRSFSRRAYDAAMSIAAERKLDHLDFAVSGKPHPPHTHEDYLTKRRHLHVAQLYATALPRVTEDLVFTLEDDVEPPPDAIRKLGEDIGYPSRGNIGAVGAAYPSPTYPEHVCAAPGWDGWTGSISWRALPDVPLDVGCVGGGATMWANWALRECAVHIQWELKLGWDGVLCAALRQRGYRVRLHGGVRCEHHREHALRLASPSMNGVCVRPRAAPPRVPHDQARASPAVHQAP